MGLNVFWMMLVWPAGSGTAVSVWLPEGVLHYVLLGFVVGLAVGLTSIGAGAIATPVLILYLDIPPSAAVGSSIVAGAVMKGIGTLSHYRQNTVSLILVRHLLVGSIPAVAGAIMILYWVGRSDPALGDLWLNRLLGLTLLFFGVCVLARDTGWIRRLQAKVGDGHLSLRVAMIGVIVGLLFGATSIGTGSLLVVLLSIFLPLPEVRVVGTAMLYGFAISLFGALLHTASGTVDWQLVLFLLLGSLPGVVLGSGLATHAPRRLLRTCFSVGAIWAGSALI